MEQSGNSFSKSLSKTFQKTPKKPPQKLKTQAFWLGSVDYKKGFDFQQIAYEKVAISQERLGLVLGMEHPEVITLGKRGDLIQDLVFPDSSKKFPFPVYRTDRGGQATIHSPGQLIIYPIFPLHPMGVRCWVQLLEKTTEKTLIYYGVSPVSLPPPLKEYGLFVRRDPVLSPLPPSGAPTPPFQPSPHSACSEGVSSFPSHEYSKIAFVGIRVLRGISLHGIAVNIQNDLSLFQLIRSCGMRDRHHTSIQSIKEVLDGDSGRLPSLEEFFRVWVENFLSERALLGLATTDERSTFDFSRSSPTLWEAFCEDFGPVEKEKLREKLFVPSIPWEAL